jgi:hypothetical protein
LSDGCAYDELKFTEYAFCLSPFQHHSRLKAAPEKFYGA